MTLADIEYRTAGHAIVARVTGEIDMSNSGSIGSAVARETPNEALGVVLDLSSVDYLDSAGIHLIYRMRDALAMRGQRLVLVIGEAAAVFDALRLAGVKELVAIRGSVDEALATLEPSDKDPAGVP